MEIKVPPMPDTLADVLRLLKDPTPDVGQLTEVVRKDPFAALHLLRRVNSVYFGLRRDVSQIDRAIILMGSRTVCNLLLATAIQHAFSQLTEVSTRQVYEQIVKTSVATAAFSRDLAQHLRLPISEAAFTAGLLHQMGRLVLLFTLRDSYAALWHRENESGPPTILDERRLLGTDHLKLGVGLVQEWGLPDEIVTAIAFQNNPDQVSQPVLRLLATVVASGRAASEVLLADDSPGPAKTALAQLADLRNVETEDLTRFLQTRSADVASFAGAFIAPAAA